VNRNGRLVAAGELTPDQALERGLVPVPPEMVDALERMTPEERLTWAAEQQVKLERGALLNVGSAMKRGRRLRNEAKRERQGRAPAPAATEVERPNGWCALTATVQEGARAEAAHRLEARRAIKAHVDATTARLRNDT
jgi:hypothetical protein